MSKKGPFKRYFPSYVKLFVSLFLSCIFFLSHKSEKRVTERNKRLNLWSLFINLGTQFFLIQADFKSLKMTCAKFNAWFLDFKSDREGLDCFSRPNISPKLIKVTVTCLSWYKQTSRVNFDLPKDFNSCLSILNCSKSSKCPVWKSTYSPDTEMLETSNLDTYKPYLKDSIGYSA